MGGIVCRSSRVAAVETPRCIALPDIGVLCVTVLQGEFYKLRNKENDDPFFVITLGTRTFRTKTIHQRSGEWNQKIVIPLETPHIQYKLKIALYDKDGFTKNDFLASEFFAVEGLIQQSEFHSWVEMKTMEGLLIGKVELKVQYLSKQEVIKRFWMSLASIFDADKSNFLDRAELASLLESMGNVMTDDEIDEMFQRTDTDGDGKIQFHEFVDQMSTQADSIQKITMQRDPITNEPISSSGDETLARMVAYVDGEDDTDIVVSRFLSEEHATKGWLSRIIAGTTYKEEDICEQSEFVQYMDRETGEVKQELIPTYIKLSMRIMYSSLLGKLRTDAKRVRKLLKHMTVNLGRKYNSPRSKRQIPNFIRYHKLNVDEILEPIDSFQNFNEFFYRKLKPGARPIFESENENRIVSPADCRCLVYSTVSNATKFWIKGKTFSLQSLLGDADLAVQFDEGSVVISRLAPQDYHRFHSPVDCTVLSIKAIDGAYYTVNPIAVRQKFDVFTTNKRSIAIMESTVFGKVAYIMIGATMVGSIIPTVTTGQKIKKGDEVGYFAFGGSTIVTIFEKGKVAFDQDLIDNSQKPLESKVKMGNSLGLYAAQ